MTKTEQKIRELVPSLQELTFGCEVEVAGVANDNPGCQYDVVVDSRLDKNGSLTLGYFGVVHPNSFKILGHPIQLHHVLQAISLCGKWYIPNLKSTGENGSAILTILKGNMSIGDTRWDLTKDFSNQTAEVQMFISHLLE